MSGQTIAVLRIDSEFRALIPPIEDRNGLEEQIKAEGCRDRLVTWQGILLDGHNRYEICIANDIEFDVCELDFETREEAYNWIIDNQLNRRNLTPDQASYLRGKKYNAEKKTHGGERESSPQNEDLPKQKTAEKVADGFGVSRATIERDGQFAKAVDTIAENVGEPARKAILSGDSPLTKKEVVAIAAKPPEEQKKAVEKMAVHYSSETPEWYTPEEIVERVIKLFGPIDLDPCSNSHKEPNIPASAHFTQADNGLSKPWWGKVYMNPPYGREIVEWTEYLSAEYDAGRVKEAVALVPSRTDTAWFRGLREHPRCFISGRLNFSQHENSAPFPSVVIYLGKRTADFVKAFGDIGDVYSLVK